MLVLKVSNGAKIRNRYNQVSKTLLQKGISESEICGDLVYLFERIVGKPSILYQFIEECHIPCILYDSLYNWL